MQSQASVPCSSRPEAGDWAEAFLARGWQGRMPWVVLEQVWCSRRRFAQFFDEPEGGWAFGAVSFRVLSAPMFDVFASADVTRRIVDAIRAYPAPCGRVRDVRTPGL